MITALIARDVRRAFTGAAWLPIADTPAANATTINIRIDESPGRFERRPRRHHSTIGARIIAASTALTGREAAEATQQIAVHAR